MTEGLRDIVNEQKSVCFMQSNLLGGGAEQRVCTLANYFVSNGYEVDIGLYGKNEVVYDLDPKVNVTFIRRNTYTYSGIMEKAGYWLSVALQKALMEFPVLCMERLLHMLGVRVSKKVSYERIHTHFMKRNDFILPIRRYVQRHAHETIVTMMISNYDAIMSVLTTEEQRKFSSRFIVMDCSDPKRNADARMVQKRNAYYASAGRSIVQTQGAKEYFPLNVQENMMIIPNPVKRNLPKQYEGTRKKTVVNYCRLTKQKNLPLLLRAFSRFHRIHPEYSLRIYGKGELKDDLERQIMTLGLVDAARICDFDAHVHEKISDAGMYVSTSDWEGFPNSLLEAMAMGMPVIATDCDFGPRDLIQNNENGILIPMDDENALVKAMCAIAENESFAAEISKKAYQAREKYSADRIGSTWAELIESVRRGHM